MTISAIARSPPASAYDTWKNGTFANAFTDTLPGSDQDNDGLENLLEFVLGGDPTISQAGIAPSVTASGSDLVVTFKRSDESELQPVAVKVQTSTTLAGWADFATIGATDGSGYTVSEDGSNPDLITVTIPKGADLKKFARVVAVQP